MTHSKLAALAEAATVEHDEHHTAHGHPYRTEEGDAHAWSREPLLAAGVLALVNEVERLRDVSDRALSEYDRMNAALNRDPSGQDWLAMRDCLRDAQSQLAARDAEVERLRAALVEACDIADEGWGYAGDYFREKWLEPDRLAALRAIAGKEKP